MLPQRSELRAESLSVRDGLKVDIFGAYMVYRTPAALFWSSMTRRLSLVICEIQYRGEEREIALFRVYGAVSINIIVRSRQCLHDLVTRHGHRASYLHWTVFTRPRDTAQASRLMFIFSLRLNRDMPNCWLSYSFAHEFHVCMCAWRSLSFVRF